MMKHMPDKVLHSIRQVDRLEHGIVVTFADGDCLFYSNKLLQTTMPFAVDLRQVADDSPAQAKDDRGAGSLGLSKAWLLFSVKVAT